MSGGTGTVRGRFPRALAQSMPPVPVLPSTHWPHVSALPLAALEKTTPARGRGHAKHVLWEWQLSHLADDTELLVSELLTNAVKASWQSRDPICLRLLTDREQLIIEVWDRSPDNPRPRQAMAEDESGRGFSVIEHLAHRWGYQRINSGWKVVWAELRTGVGRG